MTPARSFDEHRPRPTADQSVDILIIGAGPAGLTAARTLAGRGCGSVLVLDRERDAGGIPRHSDHPGYGIRDLKRFMSGPRYARRLVTAATTAGAEIRTESMVTGWCGPTSVEVTSPTGRYRIHARAVVLATGARERPRTARLVPGDRPAGVITTGQLQNLVHLHHSQIGERAVIVGAELVSWSAVLTLREAGTHVALMTTTHPRPESYGAFNLAGRLALRVPIATRTTVTRIIGKGRVQGVEVQRLDTGDRRVIPCDTVIFTGNWIPDHELARSAHLDMDPLTLGPQVNSGLHSSTPGVFAIGNLIHPVDTADIAALDGRHVADHVQRYLLAAAPPYNTVNVRVQAPLRWISPSLAGGPNDTPPRGRYLLWTDELIRLPRISIHQGGVVLASRVLPWPASPGRVFRIPSSMLGAIDTANGDVTITVASGLRWGGSRHHRTQIGPAVALSPAQRAASTARPG